MMRRTSLHRTLETTVSWQNGRARFIGLLVCTAAFAHLTLSLLSDPIGGWLGADVIAGTVEANLGGRSGAVLNHVTRTLWGALWPIAPALLGWACVRFLWPRRVRDVAMELLWAGVTTALLAGTLTGAGGPGGRIGNAIRATLVGPLGVAGAVILPATLFLVALALRCDPRRTSDALSRAGDRLAALGERIAAGFERVRRAGRTTYDRATSLRIPPVLQRRPSTRRARPVRPARPQPAGSDGPPAERPMPRFLTPDPAGETTAVLAPARPRLGLGSHETETDWAVPMGLFTDAAADPSAQLAHAREIERMGEQMMEALETYRIGGELLGHTAGARVVSYHVRPASGIKVSQFESLEREISLALKQESVRVSPAPRAGAIAIEVPHPEPRTVLFREILDSDAFDAARGGLPVALGLDLEGRVVVEDLSAMPHMLVAGATGSGKSVALNVMLTSLCTRHSPDDLRLILVDPKRVELALYGDLPHLRHPVICEPDEVHGALRWATLEMERRYELLREAGVRNLAGYHVRTRAWTPTETETEAPESLPHLVVVVDEMADLMMTEHRQSIEQTLIQLAQKARAVGIHLILATQRPDANVFSGLLKANVPVRIAFRVSQSVNSKIILDRNGAERLLGNGDMLYLGTGSTEPRRLQGAFITTEETREFVQWCADRWPAPADRDEEDILKAVRAADAPERDVFGNPVEERDDMFGNALRTCLQNDGASTSLLQRRLRIGYGRAARIMDQMEDAGLIGGENGSRARDLLYDEDLLDSLGY